LTLMQLNPANNLISSGISISRSVWHIFGLILTYPNDQQHSTAMGTSDLSIESNMSISWTRSWAAHSSWFLTSLPDWWTRKLRSNMANSFVHQCSILMPCFAWVSTKVQLLLVMCQHAQLAQTCIW
jgi:hypothetical protein